MSEKQTQTRLLKANNVQRRRFEKVADEVINRAHSKSRDDLNHTKGVLYNAAVEKAMGAELEKLLEIRKQIQKHKRAILALQETDDIKRRLNKRGIKTADGYSYRGSGCALHFYTEPPATDEQSEDVCEVIVGNHLVQLRLMDCHNNKPYADYEQAIAGLVVDEQEFSDASDDLRSQIWGVVSTDEIMQVLADFRSKWLA